MAEPFDQTPQAGIPTQTTPSTELQAQIPGQQVEYDQALEADSQTVVFDADYVRELRRENADYRTKAKTAEERNLELLREIEMLKSRNEEQALRAAVAAESAKLRIVDPEAAYTLVDKSSVTFTEDGRAQGVEDALRRLVQAKAYLVQSGSSATPPGNPVRPRARFTREQIQQMSPAEINANWEEVQAVLGS